MDTASIAQSWRQECVSNALWFESESQAGAAPEAADGLYMVSESIGWRRAYVKPAKPGGFRGRAAREKLAFDLAYDIGARVAPVVLVERHDAGKTFARHVCASLVMFPSQAPWWAVRRSLGTKAPSALRELAKRSMQRDAASALAFDTWVGQTEHRPDHPHNIILGWGPNESGFVFLDYEYAFGGLDDEWRGSRALELGVAPFPDELLEGVDRDALDLAIRRIESMDSAAIRTVLDRIPASFLDVSDREVIASGLLARKSLVRSAISANVGL